MTLSLHRPELLPLLRCPSCGGALGPAASLLECAGCGRRFPLADGRPILLANGAPEPAKQNAVIAEQARARQPQQGERPGLRGLLDRFRRATTADIFADDRQ